MKRNMVPNEMIRNIWKKTKGKDIRTNSEVKHNVHVIDAAQGPTLYTCLNAHPTPFKQTTTTPITMHGLSEHYGHFENSSSIPLPEHTSQLQHGIVSHSSTPRISMASPRMVVFRDM